MKKKAPENPRVEGWTFINNIRANCGACGLYLGLEDNVFWRMDGIRSVIRCQPCALEAVKQ